MPQDQGHGTSKNLVHHRSDGEDLDGNQNQKKKIGRNENRGLNEDQELGTSEGRNRVTGSNEAREKGKATAVDHYDVKYGYVYSAAAKTATTQAEDDMEVDGTGDGETGGKSGSSEEELEWEIIKSHGEKKLTLKIPVAWVVGETIGRKRQEIERIILGQRVNLVNTPRKVDIQGRDYFQIQVEAREDAEKLLAMTASKRAIQEIDRDEEDNNEEIEVSELEAEEDEKIQIFTVVDNEAIRAAENIRTVELYGIAPTTSDRFIRMAANKLGQVQTLKVLAVPNGRKVKAVITFDYTETVEEIKANNTQYVAVGRDLVRIGKIGGEVIRWNISHAYKLSGLPAGTSSLDLKDLMDKVQADFIEVPRFYRGKSSDFRYRREAFVYFRTQEDLDKAKETGMEFRGRKLAWCGLQDKLCYACNEKEHGIGKCEVQKQWIVNKLHIKEVQAFRRGTFNPVQRGKSFASATAGSSKTEKAQQPASRQSVVRNIDFNEENFPAITTPATRSVAKHDKEMEDQVKYLTQTVQSLSESLKAIQEQNKLLLTIVMNMFQGNKTGEEKGEKKEKEQSKDVPENLEDMETLTRKKRRTAMGDLPAYNRDVANEALAGIMALATNVKKREDEKMEKGARAQNGSKTQGKSTDNLII
ncbi:hypothetical protein BGW38_003124 [Lunasporangiospora selenospora]|uniref:Uncharacterized protein n=1 Tax=Lunasporangiospora selenospora TaxID=979761 RepID=A0A9P6FRV3_9FUNG|nr:hypothetical protein BGW38_003124 [Lunasporangiospora selenospora]